MANGKLAPQRTGNPLYDQMMRDQEKQDALAMRNALKGTWNPEEELKIALEMLKERHELAMSLLYSNDTAGGYYLRGSISGKVTEMLQRHGIVAEIPQVLKD